jgi:RNA polymerase sigma-70 factor (ECF subfamily)
MEITADILERAKKEDLKAFETIFSDYEKAIYYYILGFVGHKEAAEDITQEVFIKVYKNLATIDLEKNFKSWLYKIATNTVYDWLRKKQRHPEAFIVDDEESGFETIDEHSTYMQLEDNHDLEAALHNIPPAHRNILLLYYYEGLKYEEISETLALPINTVKTNIRRAKLALEQELKK